MTEKYGEEDRVNLLPGDVVRIRGKLRVVRYVKGSLVITGSGRRRHYWSYNSVETLVAKNLKLKPGVNFDGFTAEQIETLRIDALRY